MPISHCPEQTHTTSALLHRVAEAGLHEARAGLQSPQKATSHLGPLGGAVASEGSAPSTTSPSLQAAAGGWGSHLCPWLLCTAACSQMRVQQDLHLEQRIQAAWHRVRPEHQSILPSLNLTSSCHSVHPPSGS